MFREIYTQALKIDAPDEPLSDERKGKIFLCDRDIDRILPECYKSVVKDTKEEKIEKFSEGTLFYVFFNHCGEQIQKEAYSRLLKIGWLFSKEMKTFVQIIKRTPPNGLILYFDYCTWKKATRDVVLDQAFLGTLEGEKIEL